MDLARARRRRIRASHVEDRDYFAFEGGLNLVDTPLKMRPGQLLACQNYEPGIRGGYTRVDGYERYDGRVQPSQAMYWMVRYVNEVAVATAGATITGGTSGATGVLLFNVQSATVSNTGLYVLARVSGTFQDGEALQISAVTQATADGVPTIDDAATDEDDELYSQAATEDARAQIGVVPGEGAILGVTVYKGVVYAIRNIVGGTAARMFKSSATGWQQVSLGFRLNFDAGLAAGIAEGNTLTGATSGASAVVRRVVVRTGAFSTNDATGYLIFASITGGPFQDNENLQVSGTTRASAAGGSDNQTFLPNGRFEFRVHNFYGHSKLNRLYGVDGVNNVFEYQDSPEFFCQIRTGMTVDTPNHIGIHNNQLFLSFRGGSVQNSGVGDPTSWQVSLGANEIGIGDECTGFLEEIGDILFVFSRQKTEYILGTPGSYTLKNFNIEVGAAEWTIQRIGRGMYLDDRGFSTLAATQSYGNYAYNSFSAQIQPLIKQIKLNGTASCIVRDKNLYRAFFSDGRFVTIGVRGTKVSGITTGDYGKVVRCTFSGEELDGTEIIVFGSDDGYVYRSDIGTSFDGQPIQAFMRPVFHFSRSPSRRKKYRRAQFDVKTTGNCDIQIGVDYSFADPDEPGEPVSQLVMEGGGGFWNVDNWNEFKWNAGSGASAIIKLEGAGINIGFLIAHSSATQTAHSIEGVSLHHSMRRMNRGTSNA